MLDTLSSATSVHLSLQRRCQRKQHASWTQARAGWLNTRESAAECPPRCTSLPVDKLCINSSQLNSTQLNTNTEERSSKQSLYKSPIFKKEKNSQFYTQITVPQLMNQAGKLFHASIILIVKSISWCLNRRRTDVRQTNRCTLSYCIVVSRA